MSNSAAKLTPPIAGGAARALALAPDPIRCERVLGAGSRCSRFTIKKPDGTRDRYCVSHSRSAQAELLRAKGARAQEEARKVECARRADLLDTIAPEEWSLRGHFNETRYALFSALVKGDLAVDEVRELRHLVADAEHNARSLDLAWHPEYLR